MANVAELPQELDPEAVRIGGILRNLRKANDRTLQEVGEGVGHTHGYMSKIERGLCAGPAVALALIAPLADLYGIDRDQIVDELYPQGGPHQPPPGLRLALGVRKDGA